MKVSLNWLKDYVDAETGIDELVDSLTMAGLEVDSLYDRFQYLKTVVAGKITKAEPHPNADRLKLCTVDIRAEEEIPIVCGAPNAEAGMTVPVALPGTEFPNGLVIKESVIRKVLSKGMICSEAELGISGESSGIMALDSSSALGKSIKDILNLSDYVIEIDLTPNRPDCLSIIGVAREIAGSHKKKIKYPDCNITDSENHIDKMTSVTVHAPDLCPRYSARLAADIKIGESPLWLKNKLLSVGIRPINNVVDITNFVMMETGQPLHTFDFDFLAENRIIVRKAKENETFVTLDNKERKLDSEMLMICDGEKAVGIAGVMGGLNSEITGSTKRVLIESAYFNPSSIRKTSKKLGLNTDASHRFERGMDPNGTVKALNRAALLIQKIAGGKIIDGLIDEYPNPIPETEKVSVNIEKLNKFLDIQLTYDEIKDILESIEFKTENKDDDVVVNVPSFRVDIKKREDIIEEVARIRGYNNIPTKIPKLSFEEIPQKEKTKLSCRITEMLAGLGFSQTINYSFISPKSCDNLKLPENDIRRGIIGILNPIAEEQSVMRTSLIPGLLETAAGNTAKQIPDIKIFEIGKVYYNDQQTNQIKERVMSAVLWTGACSESLWNSRKRECDYYDIKGAVEGLFDSLNLKGIKFAEMPQNECFYTIYGNTACIMGSNNILTGLVGQVSPSVLDAYGIKQKVFIFELYLDTLENIILASDEELKMKPIPKYPSVSRDITVIVDINTEADSIIRKIKEFGEESGLTEKTEISGVYEGEPIPKGKKSITFRITYRSASGTLDDKTVNDINTKIGGEIINAFDASFPS